MKKRMILLSIFVMTIMLSSSQRYDSKEELEVCISAEEMKLYDLINEYRATKGLAEIPLSPSLTFVARTHARDLQINQPVKGNCNMHSWSSDGEWTPCCYTPDHAKSQCMWDKPSELTAYSGYGFEISYGGFGSYQANAADALKQWKKSSGHNAVIINEGVWERWGWNAIGIGVFGGYGVVWFGKAKDPETKKMEICE